MLPPPELGCRAPGGRVRVRGLASGRPLRIQALLGELAGIALGVAGAFLLVNVLSFDDLDPLVFTPGDSHLTSHEVPPAQGKLLACQAPVSVITAVPPASPTQGCDLTRFSLLPPWGPG